MATAQALTHERVPHDPMGWHRCFRNLPREHGYEALEVEGHIPPDLRGTFFKNGPALFTLYGRTYGHWFDGDGAISAIKIAGGKAQGAVRIVESEGLKEERRKGKAIYGGYGTLPKGILNRLRARVKNAANTSVMMHKGELLALWEGGKPTRLNPSDLSTLGETDLGGLILQGFSAHPHYVPQRKTVFNFGARFGRQGYLDLYALPDGGQARRLHSLPIPALSLVHDFIATENHLIFFIPPVRLNPFPLLLGLSSLTDALSWKPAEGTLIAVIPLADPTQVTWIETEAFYQWHFANAYEERGHVVVDYIRYEDFDTNAWLGSLVSGQPVPTRFGDLHRAEIDLTTGTFTTAQRWDGALEFPRVSPTVEASRHRYIYVGDQSPASQAYLGVQDGFVKVDVEHGEGIVTPAGDNRWLGEPIFVPRDGAEAEDDGHVLVMGYDANVDRSFLAIYTAKEPGADAVARLWFDHAIPLGFHGIWVPGGHQ